MKRMYVVLTIIFGLSLWAGTLLGQQGSRPVDDRDSDLLLKKLKLREEMHRRILENLMKGSGPDPDMFSDMESMMDEIMKDSFAGSGYVSSLNSSANFSMEWLESASGKTLAITPKDPKQNLDINVANGIVTIKGKSERKTPNGISISDFSSSVSVPLECDPSKVKMDQKEGKILVQFPYRMAKTPAPKTKENRSPIPPSKNDVQI